MLLNIIKLKYKHIPSKLVKLNKPKSKSINKYKGYSSFDSKTTGKV